MPGYFRSGESNPLPTGWGFRVDPLVEETFLPHSDPGRGAQWQGGAGLLPERVQTRERVEPQWQVPWQGNADFLTGVPNTDQREGFQYDIGIDGNTESFNFDEELTPQGMEAFRGRQGITSDPLRRNEGLTGSGQVKDIRTKQWPVSGTSIADSFMGNLRLGFGRFMDQLVPPAY